MGQNLPLWDMATRRTVSQRLVGAIPGVLAARNGWIIWGGERWLFHFLSPALIVRENAVIICKHLRCGQLLAIRSLEVRGLPRSENSVMGLPPLGHSPITVWNSRGQDSNAMYFVAFQQQFDRLSVSVLSSPLVRPRV